MLLLLAVSSAHAADRAQVTAALRETLQLSVERALASLGRPNGFLQNPAVRLGVPEPLAKVEAALRTAGEERQTERFVESLNRVAEQAAPSARPSLLAAATDLAVDERALAAGDTAATEILRRAAIGRVITALNPVVRDAMERQKVARRYKRFVKDYPMGGLVQGPPVDLDAYVVGRTVDGLFVTIAQEERRIRTDANARPTPLLREVFGAQR